MSKLTYRASLAGFHNPYKHKGLTPEEFLTEYVTKVLVRKKSNRFQRTKLKNWIEMNWKSQIKFVSRLFPNTLRL